MATLSYAYLAMKRPARLSGLLATRGIGLEAGALSHELRAPVETEESVYQRPAVTISPAVPGPASGSLPPLNQRHYSCGIFFHVHAHQSPQSPPGHAGVSSWRDRAQSEGILAGSVGGATWRADTRRHARRGDSPREGSGPEFHRPDRPTLAQPATPSVRTSASIVLSGPPSSGRDRGS